MDFARYEIVVALLLVFTVPIFLHCIYFRPSSLLTRPSILILGPSGSGKTSLLIFLESGRNLATHTSQAPISVEISLPEERTTGQDKYRSINDPSNKSHETFILIDTPGHGKLRHHALKNLTEPQNLRGIIFIVDATTLTVGEDGLNEAATYLHDVLLLLQKTAEASKGSKEIPVLIATNKMDLFTALPVALIKKNLETEITKVRSSRSKSLLDSDISMNNGEEDDNWLGEVGSRDFKFSQMDEFNIPIEIQAGNVLGESPSVTKWWTWISERL
ncbi:hypothetical protein K3495_g2039 [Podosphaera aphanis]|nr:hypothetical protein K3495_g2039 [Podosphaera aphanis]